MRVYFPCMRAAPRWPLATLLCLGCLLPVPAAAQVDPLPDLAAQVRELRYEDVLREARALRADPATPPATRLRAIELQALAEMGLGQSSAARRSFETLLRLDPEYALTESRPSPRVRQMYDEARRALPEEPEGGLVVGVAAPVLDGAPAAASARPTGESAIARVRFQATVDGDEVAVHPVPGGPPWRADIPLQDRDAADDLEVVVRGFAPSGALCAISPASRVMEDEEGEEALPGGLDGARGSSDTPRRRRRPEHGRPWLWAALGAVIVVGTFAIVVVATTHDTSDGGGDGG